MSVQQVSSIAKAQTNRILSFDLIRGMFLLIMFIDHLEFSPTNYFDLFTGKGRLYVSAAEGFFFLSGLLVGIVYRRRIALGFKFIFKKMWQRAFKLYILAVATTLIFAFWAVMTNHQWIKYGLPNTVNWHSLILRTFGLQFVYGWADFLSRFAILMLIAPFVFYMVAKGKWWIMVTASVVAWILRGQNFILGWQIIFNLGILTGYYWNELQIRAKNLQPKTKRIFKHSLYWLAGITFVFSYAGVYLLTYLNDVISNLPNWLVGLTHSLNTINADIWIYAQKWTMGPIRIVLFFLWMTVLYLLVEKYKMAIAKHTKGVLELLGRNSLFVYITHAFIVFGFYALIVPPRTNLLQNFAITLLGIVTLISVTFIYKMFSSHFRAKVFINLRKTLNRSKLLFVN